MSRTLVGSGGGGGKDISRVNVLRKTVSIYSLVGVDSVGMGAVGILARKGWWWKGLLASC